MHVAAYKVEEGSDADGKALNSGILRNRYNVTLIALNRSGEIITNLRSDTVLQHGDIAYVFSDKQSVINALQAFSSPNAAG